MARIFAETTFDQSDFNLHRLYAGTWNSEFYDDQNNIHNGVVYRDAYEVKLARREPILRKRLRWAGNRF